MDVVLKCMSGIVAGALFLADQRQPEALPCLRSPRLLPCALGHDPAPKHKLPWFCGVFLGAGRCAGPWADGS